MFQEIPINCRYGYARVSSQSQKDNSSLEGQKQEFIRQGIQKKKYSRGGWICCGFDSRTTYFSKVN
jgi:hypothetical protein